MEFVTSCYVEFGTKIWMNHPKWAIYYDKCCFLTRGKEVAWEDNCWDFNALSETLRHTLLERII
jgi:hypothetical protein